MPQDKVLPPALLSGLVLYWYDPENCTSEQGSHLSPVRGSKGQLEKAAKHWEDRAEGPLLQQACEALMLLVEGCQPAASHPVNRPPRSSPLCAKISRFKKQVIQTLPAPSFGSVKERA